MQYKIISSRTASSVEFDVKSLLKQGYELYGPLLTAGTSDYIYYTQAMIKKE